MTIHNHLSGLTNKEVIDSRQKFGKNTLTPPQKMPLWKKFFIKFTEPLIVILLIAFALSLAVAIYEFYKFDEGFKVLLEPIGIFIALFLATFVAFVYESRAEKKFESLSKINDESLVKVIRNDNIIQIPKTEVVVGDLVIFETGDEIPADGDLLEAVSLQVNESSLTGELMCRKTTDTNNFDSEATYKSNHVLRSSSVIEGHGMMKVTKVGDSTEYGKVYKGAQIENNVQTPLNIQLRKLAKIISYFAYAVAGLIIIARIFSYFHFNYGNFDILEFSTYTLKSLMIAITLIVVSVPEGLPMCITLSLALSMKRMLATNNLVRKMHACETMGAATVICTDKTGTLTQNQMRVYDSNFFELKNQKFDDSDISTIISEGISINSTAYLDFSNKEKTNVIGNPTEGALLLWLHDNSINYLSLRENVKIIAQLPFSTERKYMATLFFSEKINKKVLFVKGAPEIIFDYCNCSEDNRNNISNQLLEYQNKAMRTLGFAYKIIEDGDEQYFDATSLVVKDMTILGIVAISDPVRSDVADAIQDCLTAGVDVKIVTGDTPNTTKEIARQLGLWKENELDCHHITGKEFGSLSDEELLKILKGIKIVSRARPHDKQRLVQLLQQLGEVVAVTGDGTNDAPALNAAQVGLSMGDGTAVAKEASDITILDNSFFSISRAIIWGRSLYQNIQRFLLFQLIINLVACIIVFLGALLGTESPLTVTQMLWVNLIMDTFAAIALASLPPDNKVLKNKPRKITDHILIPKMIKNIVFVGLSLVLVLFALMQYLRFTEINSLCEFNIYDFVNNFFNLGEGHLSPYELTIFFTFFVMLQFWNIFNAKAFFTGKSAFNRMKESKDFVLITLIILIGQIIIVNIGGDVFNVVPIKFIDWIIIILSTSLILIFGEIIRFIKYLFIKKNN